ncbi:MAG: hypothetical protein RSE00_02490 [Clostridia bacterium]
METMRYGETKKSSKGLVIGLFLFVIIGGTIIFLAIKSEPEQVIVGQTKSDIQRLANTQKSDLASKNAAITYEIGTKKISDKSNSKIKSNMELPVISIDGTPLSEENEKIEKKYSELYGGLKSQMSTAENNFTYIVSYNSYDNMVGSQKILSVTIYQRVTDDAAKKNTTEKVDTINIDLATKQEVKQSDVTIEMFGKDYKQKITESVTNYLVSKKMMKSSEATYALTGLENYYIKDGKFHIVFTEGEVVDKKHGVLDITIE